MLDRRVFALKYISAPKDPIKRQEWKDKISKSVSASLKEQYASGARKKGGWKHTKKWKKWLSDRNKRLGIKPPSQKGKPRTEDTKSKIRRASKQNKHGNYFSKGVASWNKNIPMSEERRKAFDRTGKTPWNKGKTDYKTKPATDERKKKISENHKKKGIKPPGFNQKHTEKTKEKLRIARLLQKPISKDTSIEIKIEDELKLRNINYQKQVPLCKVAIVDFFLPEYKIIIQCDGDYWHNYPNGTEKDRKQDTILSSNGYKIYRFWEREINNSASLCVDKIC